MQRNNVFKTKITVNSNDQSALNRNSNQDVMLCNCISIMIQHSVFFFFLFLFFFEHIKFNIPTIRSNNIFTLVVCTSANNYYLIM